ncbi:MAG: amino acid permease [Candidatus Kariarchaeaceae archaeon]
MSLDHVTSEYESELAKELGLVNSISVAVGAMIGGGIFTVLGFLAGFAGPGAVFSFGIGGAIAFFTTFSYVRLAARYPSSGGEFIFLRKTFPNPLIGNGVGVLLWLGYSVTIALYAFTFGIYTTEALAGWTGNHDLFEVSGQPELLSIQRLLSAVVVFVFMYINLRGVEETGLIQNIIVAFKVGVLLFFAIVGLFFVDYDRFTAENIAPNGVANIFIGAAVIFVAYEGFQVIVNTAEEMKNPGRDIPLGMLISIIVVSLTYMGVAFAAIGMADDPSNLSEAALIELVTPWGWFAVLLITLGAVASTSSAINATLLGSSRLAYTMAQWKGFPDSLAKISEKNKVPWISIITTAAISWLFTFIGDIQSIANAGSIIFLAIFGIVNYTAISEFEGRKKLMPILTAIAIVLYIGIDIWFIIDQKKGLALVILVIFLFGSLFWAVFNGYRLREEADFQPPAIPPPMEDAIKRHEVPTFNLHEGIVVDYENLERIMVTVSGKKHESQAIQLASAMAEKYDIHVDMVNVGGDPAVFDEAKTILGNNFVKYSRIQEDGDPFDKLIEIYNRNNYQLIIMGSRRQNSVWDRLMNTSMTEKVVNTVPCPVIQVHPARYGQGYGDIDDMFVLFSGDIRDSYLARWARILDSFGTASSVFAYHYINVPLLVPLDGVSEHPAILESIDNFDEYVADLADKVELPGVRPIVLFGHNFTSSIVSATQGREPDAILIGHTYDEGFRNRLRTPLAYRIMNKVDCVLIVYHMGREAQRLSK